MNALTVRLPQLEITFLKTFVKKHNVTISRLFQEYIEYLMLLEKHPIHPEVARMSGILPPDINVKESYANYLAEKHK